MPATRRAAATPAGAPAAAVGREGDPPRRPRAARVVVALASTLDAGPFAPHGVRRRSPDRTMPRVIDADAVLAEFGRATGERLTADAFDLPGYPRGLVLRPSAELKQRYGKFRITVMETAAAARATPRLRGREPPDENEILWGYVDWDDFGNPPTWVADKLYDNVVLTWSTRVRAVDDRWRTLEGIPVSGERDR